MNPVNRMATLVALAVSCSALSPLHAATPTSTLPATVEKIASFDGTAFKAERERLKRELAAAIVAFDQWLASGDAAAQTEWRRYLHWDRWAEPIVSADDFRPEELQRISWRLYAPKDGFEHPRIVTLRSAVNAYANFNHAVAVADDDMVGELNRRLAELRRAAVDPTADEAVAEAAWWLAVTRQAPNELATLRRTFSHPPIILQAHRDLVADKLHKFQRTSSEQRQQRRVIQGATVVGPSNIETTTTASLVESPSDARLRILTRGSVTAPHNIATNGRVRVASASNAEFTAAADIYFEDGMFLATEPQADAQIRTHVKSIDAPLGFRRAAERRVAASRGPAQNQAKSTIERETKERMHQQLATAVEKLNRKASNFLNFVARTADPAERWETSVTPNAIQIGYVPHSTSGLAARLRTMPPLEGDETLGISFHDSAFQHIFRAQLGGKRWRDVDFAVMQRELTGSNTQEHMIGLEPERWSVQWDWRRPIHIEFKPDRAVVRYRFARVEVDSYTSELPFEVRAELQVSASPLGLEMRMLSPASVTCVDPDDALPPQIQTLLERKFRGLFVDRFSLHNLQFPAGGHLDGMSRFRVAGVKHDSQWIHLRYTNRGPNGEILVGETPGSSLGTRKGIAVANVRMQSPPVDTSRRVRCNRAVIRPNLEVLAISNRGRRD